MIHVDKIVSVSACLFVVYFALQWEKGETRVATLPTEVNCTSYNSSQFCPPGNNDVFCLTNGTSIFGFCDVQIAVCEENATLSDSLALCTQAGGLMTTVDPNAAVQVKASLVTAVLLTTSSIFVWLSKPFDYS